MTEYDNQFESMTITCDEKGCDSEDTFYGDYYSCIEDSKEYGWRHFKNKDEWVNRCFKHYEKETE